jgi:hypothetical protein
MQAREKTFHRDPVRNFLRDGLVADSRQHKKWAEISANARGPLMRRSPKLRDRPQPLLLLQQFRKAVRSNQATNWRPERN